jgi:hypothetical protein
MRICTQLFAGKLTNQNWEYYKVNDNDNCILIDNILLLFYVSQPTNALKKVVNCIN